MGKGKTKLDLPNPELQERNEDTRQDQQVEEAKRSNLSDVLITVADPASAASETYRMIRTNLLYSSVDKQSEAVLVTSPGPSEGKSTTCANLGVVMAQTGKSTLIIDCDFRRPTMHKLFKLRNFRGVTNIVMGECSPQEVWQEPLEGLKIIPVGQIPPNPAELLSSRSFAQFLEQVRKQFDYVLIDAPPTSIVTDPAIIATHADGVLLVLDAQNTRKSSLIKAVRSIEAVGAKVLGTVLNNIESRPGGYYSYNYVYK